MGFVFVFKIAPMVFGKHNFISAVEKAKLDTVSNYAFNRLLTNSDSTLDVVRSLHSGGSGLGFLLSLRACRRDHLFVCILCEEYLNLFLDSICKELEFTDTGRCRYVVIHLLR